MLDDIHELRHQKLEGISIAGGGDIFLNRMEVPERCVSCVIQALLLAFRKHIRYQSITNVMSKSSQNVTRLHMSSRRQCQSFETDHGVAAPVREPGVTGDDGSDIVSR